MFRRKRDEEVSNDATPLEVDPAADSVPDQSAAEASLPKSGPWDLSAAPPDRPRIDLGALLLPAIDGVEIQLQVDGSGAVIAATAMLNESSVQLMAFAAPRSEGMWEQVRRELRGAIASSGGLVDEADGPFGAELRATVPMQEPDGSAVRQPTRFVGIDGPRWFLRAMLSGAASAPGGDEVAEAFIREVVVVRGTQAHAPGDALPLRLPTEAVAPTIPGRPPLAPFQRGPEITEIR